MNDVEIIKLAASYIESLQLSVLADGRIVRRTLEFAEVRFMKPETLDPTVVIDPPDVLVLVHLRSGEVELVHQM